MLGVRRPGYKASSLVNSTLTTPQHLIAFRMHVREGGRSRDLGPFCMKFWNAIIGESRVQHAIIAYITSTQLFGAGHMYVIATARCLSEYCNADS